MMTNNNKKSPCTQLGGTDAGGSQRASWQSFFSFSTPARRGPTGLRPFA
jgi:hypothetical protein